MSVVQLLLVSRSFNTASVKNGQQNATQPCVPFLCLHQDPASSEGGKYDIWDQSLVMSCSLNEICIVFARSLTKKSEGKRCSEPALSFAHVAAFSFGGSQTADKASVKWDLAGTWTELAGMVGDIIWTWRPALPLHGQKGPSEAAGGPSGNAAVL